MKTDPKNADYSMELGATRNYEPWREKDKVVALTKAQREEEERGNAMKVRTFPQDGFCVTCAAVAVLWCGVRLQRHPALLHFETGQEPGPLPLVLLDLTL